MLSLLFAADYVHRTLVGACLAAHWVGAPEEAGRCAGRSATRLHNNKPGSNTKGGRKQAGVKARENTSKRVPNVCARLGNYDLEQLIKAQVDAPQ